MKVSLKNSLIFGLLLSSYGLQLQAMELPADAVPKAKVNWGELSREELEAMNFGNLSESGQLNYNLRLAELNAKGIPVIRSESGSSISTGSAQFHDAPGTSIPAPGTPVESAGVALEQPADTGSLSPRAFAARVEQLVKQGSASPKAQDASDTIASIPSIPKVDASRSPYKGNRSAGIDADLAGGLEEAAQEHASDMSPREAHSIHTETPGNPGYESDGSGDQGDAEASAPQNAPASDESGYSSDDEPVPSSSKLTTIVAVAGVTLVVWTAAETLIAYKNISQEEWNNAKRVHNKIDLLARKTGNAMYSRPGQIVSSAKKVLNKMMPNRGK